MSETQPQPDGGTRDASLAGDQITAIDAIAQKYAGEEPPHVEKPPAADPTPAAEPAAADGNNADGQEPAAAPNPEPAAEPAAAGEPDPGAEPGTAGEPASVPAEPAAEPPTDVIQALAEQLAEKLGKTVSEIYDIEFPLRDELGVVTLGQIKDNYQDRIQLDQGFDAIESQQMQLQNELLRTRQEISSMVSMFPGEITPQMRAAAAQSHSDMVTREYQSTMAVMPEWADPAVRGADRDLMVGTMQNYGYSEAEIANVHDHRALKMARDLSRLLKGKRDAIESLPAHRKITPSRPTRSAAAKPKPQSTAAAGEAILRERAAGGDRSAKADLALLTFNRMQ